MITEEKMFYVFLFDKKIYTQEEVEGFGYGTAFALFDLDSENVKLFEFTDENNLSEFTSLKSIKKDYYIREF